LKQEPDDDQGIALAVLSYLQEHPDAKDTLEGIAQWWLLRQCSERRLAEVKRGVSVLLAQGLIVEIRRGGLSPHYCLNKAKEKDESQPHDDKA
jgi:hypothetical protein